MNHSPVEQTLSKKAYQQPQLKIHGDLRRLTQAGTQGILEQNSGQGSTTQKA